MLSPDFAFVDGYDHYTEKGDSTLDMQSLLLREYNSISLQASGVTPAVFAVAALSGPAAGSAIQMVYGTGSGTPPSFILKTLPGNYARSIGGMTIRPDNLPAGRQGVTFNDGATAQFSIGVNATTGFITAHRGDLNAAIIATSTESIAVSTAHVIEWDITFHNSTGIIKVYLDGIICANLNLAAQDTCATANNYHNGISKAGWTNSAAAHRVTYDHFFALCYTAAGGGDAALLYSPIIESQFGTSDDTAQFNFGAGVLGKDYRTTTATNAPGAGQLALVPIVADSSGNITGVTIMPAATSAAAKLKAVLYADAAGAPAGLTATGTEVIGTVSGTALNLPFAAAQAIVAGTKYWIGFITDTSVALRQNDSTGNLGQKKANTYASGAPNPAGAMTAGQPSWQIWGVLTGVTTMFSQVNKAEPTLNEYNTESTVADKDLFNFPALAINPSAIALVSNRVCALKSDGGARTINLPEKSGGTSANGSSAGIGPAVSLTYLSSNFFADPNTGVAWGAAGVNNAKAGYEIAS